MKKVFAVILSVMLLTFSMTGITVSAEEAKTVVDGIRWFPAEPGREYDDVWEVEYEAEGCLCQRFTDNADTTGYTNYLDTVYNEDGSLTLRRNGSDGKGDHYWPRVRTLSLETYPELDLTVADTLYFDFEATDCQWMISIGINGINVGLAKDISEACGVTGVTDSISDGTAGRYVGSLNLRTALERISQEDTANATAAATILKMKTTFVPQVQIYYVGSTEGEITMNSLFISTADDPNGEKCDYLDMGLMMGDDWYNTDPDEDEGDDPVEDPSTTVPATKTTATAATTTAAQDIAQNDSGSLLWILIPVGVVIAAGAVIVAIIVRKKRT